MTERGSLNDCKICAEEVIQLTARKTGKDGKSACKSRMEVEPGSSRKETVLPARFIGQEEAGKSSAMMRTKRIPAGWRKTIGSSRFIGKGNCKETTGNSSGKTATDSENSARLLVLFSGTGPLETGSQETVKGGTLRAGNDLTGPLFIAGREKPRDCQK
jgi:hypothetical protein